MPDFAFDATPFETPEEAADIGYEQTPATLGQFLGAEAASTTEKLRYAADMGIYQGSSVLSQMLYGPGFSQAEEAGQDMPLPGSQLSPMLSRDEYQARYAPNGPDSKPVSLGDSPMSEAVAQLIGEAKRDELQREAVLQRFQDSHGALSNLGAGMIGFMLDPLRASTAFIPGIGEEAVTARLGTGIAAQLAARLGTGATAGILSQAPVSALEYAAGTQEASDYSLRDAFRDMLYAGAGNAIFHAGLGTAADLWRAKMRGEPLSDAAKIATAPATDQHAAMASAVSEIVDGRPVNITGFYDNRDPVGFIENQQQLDRDGYAPGIMQDDMSAPYELPEEVRAGVRAPTPEELIATIGGPIRKPEAAAVDLELQQAEQRFADSGAEMTPEEAQTAQGLQDADNHAAAVNEAAACLGETGNF
jgi:hypothetical protein